MSRYQAQDEQQLRIRAKHTTVKMMLMQRSTAAARPFARGVPRLASPRAMAVGSSSKNVQAVSEKKEIQLSMPAMMAMLSMAGPAFADEVRRLQQSNEMNI